MRLSLKLTIGLVLAILPVIAVSSGVRVDREIKASEADLRDDDVMLGRTVAGAATTIWRAAGEAEVRLLVDGANQREHHVTIRWVWLGAADRDHDAPLVDPGPLVVRTRAIHTRLHPSDATDSLLTYVAVTSPDGRRGAIEVRRSLAAQQSFVRHAIEHAVTVTAVVVGVCGVLALGLGVALVGNPVRRLVAQTRRIGEGNLSTRLRLAQRDELGQLGHEIDAMCDRLVEARDRLTAETSAKIAALEQVRHADRLATVGKLAAGVAHEIGTPLNVISGHAQLITDDHEPGSADFENGTIVIEQTQRVAQIIRQLLDFARRRSPRRTEIDLGQLVRETLALLHPLAAERHITVAVDVVGDGLVCSADHGQIQQALTNLVVNAFQAIGSVGRVNVSVTRDRTSARIEVVDTGIGIATDALPHIFEPFFTTKDVGKGSGLGLSVSYGIVKEHDGRIDVVSKFGEGSRFAIVLPVAPATSNQRKETS